MTDFYAGRKVLVTGGVGFIGSNLVHRLVALGAEVVVVDSMLRQYGARLENLEGVADRVDVNFSDIRDAHSLGYLVQGRDLIFSLAGQVSHIDSMRDPMTDLEINGRSQLSLLECCRRENPGAKIVFASTRQVYGRPRYLPVDEAHPIEPVDVNGINKLAAERYYALYDQIHGVRSVSLRLTNTYGPRMDLVSDTKGFVGIFVRRALRGETVRIYGGGEQRRDFNYVDDVVDALLVAGANDAVFGDVFNLGHPEPLSLLDFVSALHAVADFEHEIVPFPPDAKAIDIGDYYGDFSKFAAATGWQPQVDVATGLERTLAYHRRVEIPSGSGP
ncbi:MAG: NAD-dependent epimerase/dehydratase family protein [Myxococcota bacterium]|nr:NAD-dependent epimerase/dehydratase family protein [Myxococcota bacterium]